MVFPAPARDYLCTFSPGAGARPARTILPPLPLAPPLSRAAHATRNSASPAAAAGASAGPPAARRGEWTACRRTDRPCGPSAAGHRRELRHLERALRPAVRGGIPGRGGGAAGVEPEQRCPGIGPAARSRAHRGSPPDPVRESRLPVQPGEHQPPVRGPHPARAPRVPAGRIPLAYGGGVAAHGTAQARLGAGVHTRGGERRAGAAGVPEGPVHERIRECPCRGAHRHRRPVRGGRERPRVPGRPRRARGGRRAAGITRGAVRRGRLLPPGGFRRGPGPRRPRGRGQDRPVGHRRDQLPGPAPARHPARPGRLRFAGRRSGIRDDRSSR